MQIRTLLMAAAIALPTASLADEDWASLRGGSVPQLVTSAAQAHGVPAAFANAIAATESRHNCAAIGRAGELGPMQIKPATARGVGVSINRGSACSTKVEASMRYLKQALVMAGGSLCGAATLYNRGIYARPTSSGYCRSVMSKLRTRVALEFN